MSVIDAFGAMPNRIEILHRFLQAEGGVGVERKEVEELLAPAALRRGGVAEGNSTVREVIAEAVRLKLVEEYKREDGATMLRPAAVLEGEVTPLRLRLEQILLDPELAADAAQQHFPFALAWLLEQDPARPISFGQNVSDEIQARYGAGNDFGLSNRDRTSQLSYWAVYLGFAWRLGGAVVPDPSEALGRYLAVILEGVRELTIARVIDAWSELCPVLEGGSARRRLRELQIGIPRSTDQLSRSTSLALARLERRGLIHMERRADAPALLLQAWPELRPVSHVALTRGGR